MVDGLFEPDQCAVQGLGDRRALMFRGNRLQSGQAGLYHATLVVRAGLLAVLVGETDHDAGHAVAETRQHARDRAFDLLGQLRAAVDVVVGVDLNLHNGCSVFLRPSPQQF